MGPGQELENPKGTGDPRPQLGFREPMQRNATLAVVLLLLAAISLAWWSSSSVPAASAGLGPSTGAVGFEPELALVPGAQESPNLPESGDSAPIQTVLASRAEDLPGECIDHHDLEGVPGVRLTFLTGKQPAGSAVSDEKGQFRLSVGLEELDDVHVEPPAGWWCVKHGPKRGVYQVRLAKDDVSPLRAKLVDRWKGDALPEFTVKLVGPNGWEEVQSSDEQGLIQSETLFESGVISVRETTEEFGEGMGGRELASHAHTAAGAEPQLASIVLDGGATYFMDLDNPGGVPLSQLRANLTTLSYIENGFGQSMAEFGTILHPGKSPWVRMHWQVPKSQVPVLLVEDLVGRWRGYATVEHGIGVHQTPVMIRLESRIRVSGHVYGANGEPVQDALVQFDLAQSRGFHCSMRTSVLGLYVFDGVPPGTYEVQAHEEKSGRAELELIVSGTDPLEQNIRLEPYDVGGDVSGTVRSLSGTFKERSWVNLVPLNNVQQLPNRVGFIVWSEVGGVMEGRYKIEALAAGEYRFDFYFRSDYDFEPHNVIRRASAGGTDFLVRDDVERYGVSIYPMDEALSGRFMDANLRLVDVAGNVLYDGLASGYGRPRCLAEGEEFSWSIQLDGYQPQSGGREAYEALERIGRVRRAVLMKPLPSSD